MIFTFILKKKQGSKLVKLGQKKLLTNNVLVLEIDSKGMLMSKKFYNKDDMMKIKFDDEVTQQEYSKQSFVYNFLYSLRQRINDPLGKKRIQD